MMPLPQLSRLLGYAGLIPFVYYSAATWLALPLAADPHFILSAYAAVILSFMGAIHWGVAMSRAGNGNALQLALSVIPALAGWSALLLQTLHGYSLLILCFVALCIADKRATDRKLLPGWYLPMRIRLTTVVVLSLVAAAAARVLH